MEKSQSKWGKSLKSDSDIEVAVKDEEDDEGFSFLKVGEFLSFPSVPPQFEKDFILEGGNLSPGMVLSGYLKGFFPWYNEGDPVLWWNPLERMVLMPHELHLTSRMKRTLRSGQFTYSIDQYFRVVMENCGTAGGRDEAGTWVSDCFLETYCHLFEMGFAHSIEVYQDGVLVGGLYGVLVGRVFCGESMFSLVSNSSKAALHCLCEIAQKRGIQMIDCQMPTDHLFSLGAKLIPRKGYVEELQKDWGGLEGKSDEELLSCFFQNDGFSL